MNVIKFMLYSNDHTDQKLNKYLQISIKAIKTFQIAYTAYYKETDFHR